MPLRGQDHTFALANCRALLFKLEREIKRYREPTQAIALPLQR
jgi:hypothetical protein